MDNKEKQNVELKECREAFEKWFCNGNIDNIQSLIPYKEGYSDWKITFAWRAWRTAWQDRTLPAPEVIPDEALEEVAWAITNADREFLYDAKIPHRGRHLAKAALKTLAPYIRTGKGKEENVDLMELREVLSTVTISTLDFGQEAIVRIRVDRYPGDPYAVVHWLKTIEKLLDYRTPSVGALQEVREALAGCLREHGGYTIRGECERKAKQALATLDKLMGKE